MEFFSGFFSNLAALRLPHISIIDVFEIMILAFVIYQVLLLVQNTRTWFLIRGIVVLLAIFAIAVCLKMNTILFIVEHSLSVIVIALVVVFQQELRKALEQLGTKSNFIFSLFGLKQDSSNQCFNENTISELVKACLELGRTRTGALIVIERGVPLEEYVSTGIPVDAVITSQLLINIFEHNTPLHDGAVIVREERVVSATCYLPLSKNMDIPKSLGTRHRAAIGVSEVTDSLTIIVSEETGKISIAEKGELTHNLSQDELQGVLQSLCKPEEEKPSTWSLLKAFIGKETKE